MTGSLLALSLRAYRVHRPSKMLCDIVGRDVAVSPLLTQHLDFFTRPRFAVVLRHRSSRLVRAAEMLPLSPPSLSRSDPELSTHARSSGYRRGGNALEDCLVLAIGDLPDWKIELVWVCPLNRLTVSSERSAGRRRSARGAVAPSRAASASFDPSLSRRRPLIGDVTRARSEARSQPTP